VTEARRARCRTAPSHHVAAVLNEDTLFAGFDEVVVFGDGRRMHFEPRRCRVILARSTGPDHMNLRRLSTPTVPISLPWLRRRQRR
jgi:hypothetical protein